MQLTTLRSRLTSYNQGAAETPTVTLEGLQRSTESMGGKNLLVEQLLVLHCVMWPLWNYCMIFFRKKLSQSLVASNVSLFVLSINPDDWEISQGSIYLSTLTSFFVLMKNIILRTCNHQVSQICYCAQGALISPYT